MLRTFEPGKDSIHNSVAPKYSQVVHAAEDPGTCRMHTHTCREQPSAPWLTLREQPLEMNAELCQSDEIAHLSANNRADEMDEVTRSRVFSLGFVTHVEEILTRGFDSTSVDHRHFSSYWLMLLKRKLGIDGISL